MSTRRRHAGRRVRDAIAVFEKNEGTIVFTAEGGQPPLKSPASSRRSPTSPDSTEQSERTPVPPTGSTGGQQSLRNARSVGEWTKEKVYVLELTRGRADDQAERQLRSGPVKTGGSGKDTSVDKKQTEAPGGAGAAAALAHCANVCRHCDCLMWLGPSISHSPKSLGQTTTYSAVSHRAEATRQRAETTRQEMVTTRQGTQMTRQGAETTRQGTQMTRQGAETTRQGAETTRQGAETTRQGAETTRQRAEMTRRRSSVLDLLKEAQQLMEELVVVQGVASPLQLQQTAGCPAHCPFERQLQALHADVSRLEMENASLHRELASMRWKEERSQAQLDELHRAYFSLQQCVARQVQKVKLGRTRSEGRGESTGGQSRHYRPLTRAASSQESSV